MKVLLVEDSDDLRSLFARAMRRHGFTVRAPASARAALECLTNYRPDIVVTDLMMPVIDGVELIRRLRADPTTAVVPIVAITADVTPEAERRAREAGAADFLVKPVDLVTLLDRLRLLLSGGDHEPAAGPTP
jgi:DNA-binding response OmpR family regulator